MKKLAIGLLLICAPAAAHAETFTFVSTSKPIDSVTLPPAAPGGRPFGAQVFNIATVTTFADGKKLQTSGKCSSWVLPSGSQFGSSGACAYTDAAGALYTVQYSCEVPQKGGADCWGKLIGQGGQWKGRSGAFGFHNGTDSHGAGQWND